MSWQGGAPAEAADERRGLEPPWCWRCWSWSPGAGLGFGMPTRSQVSARSSDSATSPSAEDRRRSQSGGGMAPRTRPWIKAGSIAVWPTAGMRCGRSRPGQRRRRDHHQPGISRTAGSRRAPPNRRRAEETERERTVTWGWDNHPGRAGGRQIRREEFQDRGLHEGLGGEREQRARPRPPGRELVQHRPPRQAA